MILSEFHWQLYDASSDLLFTFSHKKKKSNLRAYTVFVGIYKPMLKIWGVKKVISDIYPGNVDLYSIIFRQWSVFIGNIYTFCILKN